jgi:hypothetical protein
MTKEKVSADFDKIGVTMLICYLVLFFFFISILDLHDRNIKQIDMFIDAEIGLIIDVNLDECLSIVTEGDLYLVDYEFENCYVRKK